MLTKHARIRCQQRGIQKEVVEALLTYGRCRYHRGAEIRFMDKAARLRMRRLVGKKAYARVSDRLDAYLVVSEDGAIVTAAKRLGRLKF